MWYRDNSPYFVESLVQCHHCPFSVCVPITTSWCPNDWIYRHEHWVHMRAHGDKIVWSRRPRKHLDYFFYYYGKSKYKYDKYIVKRSCLRANSRFLYKYDNNLKILFDSIINEETNKMLSTDLTEFRIPQTRSWVRSVEMNLQVGAKLAFLHRVGMKREIFPPVEGICIPLHRCCFNFYELPIVYIFVN